MTRGISKGSGRTFMLRSLIVILAISMMVMFTPTIAFAADDTAAQTSTQTTSEATPEAAATTAAPTTTTASGTEAASDAGTKTDTEGSTAEVTDPVENTESAATQDVTEAKTAEEAAKDSDISYNIGENASGTQLIDLNEEVLNYWAYQLSQAHKNFMPGSSMCSSYTVNGKTVYYDPASIGITSSSKHTYQIDANSLKVTPIGLEETQKIAIIPNHALGALFGKTKGSDFTWKDLTSEGITAQLKAKGFDGDLYDYYLQYYNNSKEYNPNGITATTLYDLPIEARNDIIGGGSLSKTDPIYNNGIRSISEEEKAKLEKDTNNIYRISAKKSDGTYDLQVVSNDLRITDMQYYYWLSESLQLDVKGSSREDFTKTISDGSNVQNAITDYMTDSAEYQQAAKYLASINGGEHQCSFFGCGLCI